MTHCSHQEVGDDAVAAKQLPTERDHLTPAKCRPCLGCARQLVSHLALRSHEEVKQEHHMSRLLYLQLDFLQRIHCHHACAVLNISLTLIDEKSESFGTTFQHLINQP